VSAGWAKARTRRAHADSPNTPVVIVSSAAVQRAGARTDYLLRATPSASSAIQATPIRIDRGATSACCRRERPRWTRIELRVDFPFLLLQSGNFFWGPRHRRPSPVLQFAFDRLLAHAIESRFVGSGQFSERRRSEQRCRDDKCEDEHRKRPDPPDGVAPRVCDPVSSRAAADQLKPKASIGHRHRLQPLPRLYVDGVFVIKGVLLSTEIDDELQIDFVNAGL